MTTFKAWCPMLSWQARPADGDCVCHREKAGCMDWLIHLLPTNKVSSDLKYSTLVSRTHSWGSRSHILLILCVRSVGNGGGVSNVANAPSMHLIPTNKVSHARR